VRRTSTERRCSSARSPNQRAVEQGDEADEAGASDGASQLIPGVGRTRSRSDRRAVMSSHDSPTIHRPRTRYSRGAALQADGPRRSTPPHVEVWSAWLKSHNIGPQQSPTAEDCLAGFSEDEQPWLAVIARALAFLSLHAANLRDEEIGHQAEFLQSLGLSRSEIAPLLGSTPASIEVLLRRKRRRKRPGGTDGKKPSKRQKRRSR
jgi:hypothetical protein